MMNKKILFVIAIFFGINTHAMDASRSSASVSYVPRNIIATDLDDEDGYVFGCSLGETGSFDEWDQDNSQNSPEEDDSELLQRLASLGLYKLPHIGKSEAVGALSPLLSAHGLDEISRLRSPVATESSVLKRRSSKSGRHKSVTFANILATVIKIPNRSTIHDEEVAAEGLQPFPKSRASVSNGLSDQFNVAATLKSQKSNSTEPLSSVVESKKRFRDGDGEKENCTKK